VWQKVIAKNSQPEEIKYEQLSEVIGIASNLAKEQTEQLKLGASISTKNVVEEALQIANDSKLLSDKDRSLAALPTATIPADVKDFGLARLEALQSSAPRSLRGRTPPSSASDTTTTTAPSSTTPRLRGTTSSDKTESTYSFWNPLKRIVKLFADTKTPPKSLPAPSLSEFAPENPFSLDSSSTTVGSMLSSGLAGPSLSSAVLTTFVATILAGIKTPTSNLLPFAAASSTLPAFTNILGQVQHQLVYAY
jgi:hypothetical protein